MCPDGVLLPQAEDEPTVLLEQLWQSSSSLHILGLILSLSDFLKVGVGNFCLQLKTLDCVQ